VSETDEPTRQGGDDGRAVLTELDVLPPGARLGDLEPTTRQATYLYRYTTGPFFFPMDGVALDWVLLNNEPAPQAVRMVIYSCPIGAAKTVAPPGPVELTVPGFSCFHNANSYTVGFAYEVQVECNSRLVFPYVSVWKGHSAATTMPGVGFNSSDFIRMMT